MKKFSAILLLTVCIFSLAGENNFDSLKGLAFINAKIPVYQDDELQMMIFADRGKRDGGILRGDGIVLDLILPHSDVDLISDGWKTRMYPLGAKMPEVLDFWKKRIAYSQGVMVTSKGDVDQKRRASFGNERVFFRSPTIDLNGTGYFADFNRRTIQVNSDVDVVMRTANCDPERIFSGSPVPEEYHFITATSDSLLIDNDKKQILLVGNAHVKELDTQMDCERLTIFLGGKEKKDPDSLQIGSASGIRIVLGDGSVEMSDGDVQKAFSDHLHYELEKNRIILTSDPGRAASRKDRVKLVSLDPETHRPTSTLLADRADFYRDRGIIVFTGNVNIYDESGTLDCDRVDLFLTTAPKEKSDRVIGGGTGPRRIERAVCTGHVHMVDPKATLDSDSMTLFFAAGDDKTKAVSGLLHSGKSQLTKIVCDGNVHGSTVASESAGTMFGALGSSGRSGRRFVSDHLISDQITDFTELHGNVCVRDDTTKLECEDMYLYSKPKAAVAAMEDVDADPFAIVDSESYAPSKVMLADGRELEKIRCEKNVNVTSVQENGSRVRAEGDHGLYVVENKRFTITADPDRYCRIRGDGRIQRSEKVYYDLIHERFFGESRPGRAVYSEKDPNPIPEF